MTVSDPDQKDGDGDDDTATAHATRLGPASPSAVHAALLALSDDVGGLWALPSPTPPPSSLPPVPILDRPPSPLVFLREYVARSRPCIIRNAVPNGDGNGPLRLTLDDLVDMLERAGDDGVPPGGVEEVTLTVDATPDGRGDCVRTAVATVDGSERRMFVTPEERRMSVAEFRDALRAGRDEAAKGDRGAAAVDGESKEIDVDGLAIFPVGSPNGGDRTESESISNTDEAERRTGRGPRHHPVLYYSRQNDCLRTELAPLFASYPDLFPRTFPWAEEAFGTGPPDAVNLWVGDERAVSCMHKDHYENLFYVASGEKVFTLCPPGDVPFLHEDEFESGTFREGGGEGGWSVVPDYDEPEVGADTQNEGKQTRATTRPEKVRWIEPDIDRLLEAPARGGDGDDGREREAYLRRYPLLRYAHPARVRVREGDLLYLPSLWFHRVTQTSETVGINYWYDMRFNGPGWSYFNFLQSLGVKAVGDGAATTHENDHGNGDKAGRA